ncbi:MAG: Radical domain protein, partial [bacterium]|nr:Radical domain protein [bacterium]
SRLAGQLHVPACDGCNWRPICPGVRSDYLERFGDEEIAAARGQPSRVAASRRLPLFDES